jgi:hypothetical protein
MNLIENGRIDSTMLGYEDHGVLTFWLMLSFAGSGQGFGGWVLDGKPAERTARAERVASAACGVAVAGILRAVGVEKWENLKGAHVRVRRDGERGTISAIGHIIEDKWFDPKATFDAMLAGGAS